jgi:hypothetical protein
VRPLLAAEIRAVDVRTSCLRDERIRDQRSRCSKVVAGSLNPTKRRADTVGLTASDGAEFVEAASNVSFRHGKVLCASQFG